MKGYVLGPCPSKILSRRWMQNEKEIHKKKLKTIKSCIREQY